RVALIDYRLFRDRAAAPRKQILVFVLSKLLPSADIANLSTARLQALLLVQNYLSSHARTGGALSSEGPDAFIAPSSFLTVLLKIIKLDGRMPRPGLTTAEQLRQEVEREAEEGE